MRGVMSGDVLPVDYGDGQRKQDAGGGAPYVTDAPVPVLLGRCRDG